MTPAPDAQSPLALEPSLALPQARPLYDQILARRGHPLTLDAAAVEHLGAQCAQVLLAARLAWAADGHPFAIAAPSPAFTDGLRLLGLQDHLQGEGH